MNSTKRKQAPDILLYEYGLLEKLKAILIDFYGTVAHEDGAVFENVIL